MTAVPTESPRKRSLRRLVDEVMNARNLDVLGELCTPAMARRWRAWVTPFQVSFALVEEGDTVVGRFTCSGTHSGEWRGQAPTGRRFEDVDEVYFFTFDGERIADAWGLEDTLDRLRQLGL
jgi:predicted ester cyclase